MGQFLLYSKMTQFYIYILFYTLFHQSLSQEIGYICLCCVVGTYYLLIVNVIVCIS